jgi:hypothetical protein
VRILPGNTGDIGAGDPDIGQLTVTELIELAQARIVAAPSAKKFKDIGDNHVRPPIGCAAPKQQEIMVNTLNKYLEMFDKHPMVRCTYALNA